MCVLFSFSAAERRLPRPSCRSGDGYDDTVSLPENFCIIEGRTTVQDFARLGLQELKEGMNVRRNKIFLLMEEVGGPSRRSPDARTRGTPCPRPKAGGRFYASSLSFLGRTGLAGS